MEVVAAEAFAGRGADLFLERALAFAPFLALRTMRLALLAPFFLLRPIGIAAAFPRLELGAIGFRIVLRLRLSLIGGRGVPTFIIDRKFVADADTKFAHRVSPLLCARSI